jgi:hypothetical protein
MSLCESTEYSDAAYSRFCAFPRRVRPASLGRPAPAPSRRLRDARARQRGSSSASSTATHRWPAALCRAQSASIWRRLHRAPLRRRGAPICSAACLPAGAPDDRSQAAPAPVTLNMPVLNYAPSAFGNRAHPPVDPKFDRQVVAYRGEEKPGTIVIDTRPIAFFTWWRGAARPCATASASAVQVSPGPA